MECINGRGRLEDLMDYVEKILKDTGKKYKKKVFGRIIEYKYRFFKTVIIYNHSDSTFKICGSEKFIEKLLKNRVIYSIKIYFEQLRHGVNKQKLMDKLHEEVYELLMRRQEAINYYSMCKREKYLIPIFTIIVFLLLTILWRSLYLSIESSIIFLIIITLLPRTIRFNDKLRLFPIIKCLTISKKLEKIDNEITARIKYLPENDPLRTIALIQLSEK